MGPLQSGQVTVRVPINLGRAINSIIACCLGSSGVQATDELHVVRLRSFGSPVVWISLRSPSTDWAVLLKNSLPWAAWFSLDSILLATVIKVSISCFMSITLEYTYKFKKNSSQIGCKRISCYGCLCLVHNTSRSYAFYGHVASHPNRISSIWCDTTRRDTCLRHTVN